MAERDTCLQRRRALASMGALAAWGWSNPSNASEAPTGWLQPRLKVPALQVIDSEGRKTSLDAAVSGKVTAVQLVFTGCSSTCPIQGALFAAIAARRRSADVQLLSISIDALGDTPAALSSWQARFGKHPAWRAAVADVRDVDRIGDFMKGVAGKSGTHTAQVFVFDPQGRLAYRTGDSPGINEVEALVARLSQAA